MSDSFEDAVAGVQAPQKKGQEMAETFYEKREYPVVPAGFYKAMIVKSELKESKSDFDEPGTTKINLRLEILSDLQGNPITYKGDDEKDRRYQVFAKPLAKNYGNGKKTGKPSNLYKLIMELTGIPPLTDERADERVLEGGRKVKGILITFDYKMLEYMECIVNVKHQEYPEGSGTMTAYIDAYSCDPAMRRKNYDQLPPHPKKVAMADGYRGSAGGASIGTAPSAQQQTNVAEAAGEVFVPERRQPTPPAQDTTAPAHEPQFETLHRTPAEEEAVKSEARAAGFPID